MIRCSVSSHQPGSGAPMVGLSARAGGGDAGVWGVGQRFVREMATFEGPYDSTLEPAPRRAARVRRPIGVSS